MPTFSNSFPSLSPSFFFYSTKLLVKPYSTSVPACHPLPPPQPPPILPFCLPYLPTTPTCPLPPPPPDDDDDILRQFDGGDIVLACGWWWVIMGWDVEDRTKDGWFGWTGGGGRWDRTFCPFYLPHLIPHPPATTTTTLPPPPLPLPTSPLCFVYIYYGSHTFSIYTHLCWPHTPPPLLPVSLPTTTLHVSVFLHTHTFLLCLFCLPISLLLYPLFQHYLPSHYLPAWICLPSHCDPISYYSVPLPHPRTMPCIPLYPPSYLPHV